MLGGAYFLPRGECCFGGLIVFISLGRFNFETVVRMMEVSKKMCIRTVFYMPHRELDKL